MRVKRQIRKDATLLMLYYRQRNDLSRGLKPFEVTAYTVAHWHSIPQSNAWKILNELWRSRFISRKTKQGDANVITYSLNKSGQNYLDKHMPKCIAAQNTVYDWKVEKYKRGLSK